MAQVFSTYPGVKAHLESLFSSSSNMPYPSKLLMVTPDYFSVDYVINPYMEGNIGKVNKETAFQQWNQVKSAFEQCGLNVRVIDGQPGLPDMVFCANQSLPFIDNEGSKKVMMSIMHSDHRKKEVPFIEQFYEDVGYKVFHLPETDKQSFEGMGDAIWHPGKKVLWGGYGFRTSQETYDIIADKWDVPVIALTLVKPEYYHLDTCLSMLNEESALIYPGAFAEESLKILKTVFSNLIEVSEPEARNFFACNATCPDGKHVVIQRGAKETMEKLQVSGFEVIETETSEFLKSGGSVFCMKMLYW